MGAVLDGVKRHVPASYSALVGSTNSYLSATDVQYLADYVQFRLFGTVPGAAQEASVWTDRKKLELISIITTLQFIPAAIDYWGDQIATQSLSGTKETNAFFDRRGQLWTVFDKLAAEAKELATEIGVAYGTPAVVPRVSYGDNGREILITEDPSKWFHLHPDVNDTVIWTDI